MADVVVTPVVADAPICERINQLGDEIIAAGRTISVQMHMEGDTAETYQIGGVSHALQTVLQQAHRSGMTDHALFVAFATAVGYFANAQALGPIETVCQQLGIKGAKAARAAQASLAAGFPTRGSA
ncbi:hypothetical protein [Caulobacter sp.]|uniref:hypothetical protein n=1 Tax=Caulobacter sp. TaxID=78 RepID=UPI002B469611|nr:hypothetical protein [Caulobacter sp.]HJV42385.1 hypothetical protein [Caulobacter sp.]